MDQHLLSALDATPEAFAVVEMLYVAVTINNTTFPLLVDTGAQRTILSPSLVEKVNIGHLVDRRFVGMAQGVGTKQMDGRIHRVDMDIGFMQCDASFVILDIGEVGGLLGLDWMRKHRISVDLQRNGLVIPTGFKEETAFVPFMPEWEVLQMKRNLNLPAIAQPHLSGQMLGSNNINQSIPKPAPQPVSHPVSHPVSQPVSQPFSQPVVPPAVDTNKLTPEQEKKINTLVEMGFPKSAVKQALLSTNWNIELAGGLLFM